MTQEELRKELVHYFRQENIAQWMSNEMIDDLMKIFSKHVKEVIGEDEADIDYDDKIPDSDEIIVRDGLREEQREKAGL